MKRPMKKLRRFQSGGDIPAIMPGPNAQIYQPKTESMGSQIMSGISTGLKGGAMYNQMTKGGGGQKDTQAPDTEDVSGGSRKGGPIKKTYGPRIGKEDGIIAAQKGEYVVRKSAVNKLGKKTLDTINRGKIPDKGARRGR